MPTRNPVTDRGKATAFNCMYASVFSPVRVKSIDLRVKKQLKEAEVCSCKKCRRFRTGYCSPFTEVDRGAVTPNPQCPTEETPRAR